MAILSYGYPETVGADAEIWAKFSAQAFGRRYAALTHADFRVTAATSGTTRRVNISAGWIAGQGVLVHNTTSTFLDLDAPAGTSQWLCVVLKRWQGGGDDESALGVVAGTSSRLVPTLVHDPGTTDDQALALCRVSSSSGLVQEVVDLRAISFEAGGFYICHFPEAMELLEDMVGVDVYRTDTKTFYKRISDGSGALAWKNMSLPDESIDGITAFAGFLTGWSRETDCRTVRNGSNRWSHLSMERVGGTISSDERGAFGDIVGQSVAIGMATMHDADKPERLVNMTGRILTPAGNAFIALASAAPSGTISLIGTAPNLNIINGSKIYLDGNWYR